MKYSSYIFINIQQQWLCGEKIHPLRQAKTGLEHDILEQT